MTTQALHAARKHRGERRHGRRGGITGEASRGSGDGSVWPCTLALHGTLDQAGRVLRSLASLRQHRRPATVELLAWCVSWRPRLLRLALERVEELPCLAVVQRRLQR